MGWRFGRLARVVKRRNDSSRFFGANVMPVHRVCQDGPIAMKSFVPLLFFYETSLCDVFNKQ